MLINSNSIKLAVPIILFNSLSFSQNVYFDTANVNNLKFAVLSDGLLGETRIGNRGGALYMDQVIFWSAGLYLSGYADDSLWSIGMHPQSTSSDFLPGKVNSSIEDTSRTMFKLLSSDPPFGDSWKEWEEAVALGAKFYDGDNNGKYEPIDYNQNGVWDTTEDRPDLLGDLTIWCVYNDANPKFENVDPQGIEVRQTVFQFEAVESIALKNTIFVRYEIESKNESIAQFDSVYFGIVTDPDIGVRYDNDLVGYDINIESGFAYKSGADDSTSYGSGYGKNPPSIFSVLLQGPQSFIPDITFLDNNNNGILDEGDSFLQTAILKYGPYISEKYVHGAVNLKPTSFFHFFRYGLGFRGPANKYELRNILLGGLSEQGDSIDVCTHRYGNGDKLANCKEIDPRFMYNGDPVSQTGWLCTIPADTRMVVSSGPFSLIKNEPVTIVYAYVVGRGSDHLNSIEVAREYAKVVKEVYENNFVDLPVGFKTINSFVDDFTLYQNYPNPFNPTTTIKYSIPKSSHVELKIYDVLGREVISLVNEYQKQGNYKVIFNGSRLASGVYFCNLTAGEYSSDMKMVLIK